MKCETPDCGRTGPSAHVEPYTVRQGSRIMLCRWCRAVRTRERRQAAMRRARSAVAQPVERPVVTREGAGSMPARGASSEPVLKPVLWAVALALFFCALAFYSCNARPAEANEAAPRTAWCYETETSLACTDDSEQIPARYREAAREVPLLSIFDYERTTIIPRSGDAETELRSAGGR